MISFNRGKETIEILLNNGGQSTNVSNNSLNIDSEQNVFQIQVIASSEEHPSALRRNPSNKLPAAPAPAHCWQSPAHNIEHADSPQPLPALSLHSLPEAPGPLAESERNN